MSRLKRVLGLVEGHEEKAKEGITKAQKAVGEGSDGDTGDQKQG